MQKIGCNFYLRRDEFDTEWRNFSSICMQKHNFHHASFKWWSIELSREYSLALGYSLDCYTGQQDRYFLWGYFLYDTQFNEIHSKCRSSPFQHGVQQDPVWGQAKTSLGPSKPRSNQFTNHTLKDRETLMVGLGRIIEFPIHRLVRVTDQKIVENSFQHNRPAHNWKLYSSKLFGKSYSGRHWPDRQLYNFLEFSDMNRRSSMLKFNIGSSSL